MIFVFTFILIAGLEVAVADKSDVPEPPENIVPEEPDMCVGCDVDKKEENEDPEQLTVEIRVDPVTGKVVYIIRGIKIEK